MAKRRARGEGSVMFAPSKQCWVYRAIVGYNQNGKAKYVEGRCRSQGEAIRKMKAAERAGRHADTEMATVGEFLDRWLVQIKPTIRQGTWKVYESIVRLHLKPNVGGIRIAQFKTYDVNKLFSKLTAGGVSSGNCRKISEVISSAMEAAVREGTIPTSPTRGSIKPRTIRPPVEVFTDAEVRSILDTVKGSRLEALIYTAIGSGARQGELFALEVGDVDWDEGTIHIRRSLDQSETKFTIQPPKSRRGIRKVALPEFALESIRRHLAGRKNGILFPDTRGGYIRRSNFIRRDWKAILKDAGVPFRKFHTTRHTSASRLLAVGVDPAEVARRLGDSIDVLLKSYSHWMKTNRNTAATLDGLYGDKKKPDDDQE